MGSRIDKTWRLTEWGQRGKDRRNPDETEVLRPDNSMNGDLLTRIEKPTQKAGS